MHRNEWVENADRWVAGFLEMFEEGCHKMVSSCTRLKMKIPVLYGWVYCHDLPNILYEFQGTAIRDRIQERLRGQQSGGSKYLLNGKDDDNNDDEEYYYDEFDYSDDEEEYYYDDEESYDEEDEKDEKDGKGKKEKKDKK